MKVLKLEGSKTDSIVLLFTDFRYVILTYDIEGSKIHTVAKGQITERIKTKSAEKKLLVSNKLQIIVFYVYESLLHTLRNTAEGWRLEKFRLKQSHIADMCFYCTKKSGNIPQIAAIHRRSSGKTFLLHWHLNKEKMVVDTIQKRQLPQPTASKLIPLGNEYEGLLTFGIDGICYVKGEERILTLEEPLKHQIFAITKVKDNRFLYGNSLGTLSTLVIETDSKKITNLMYMRVGIISTPSAIVSLGGGRAFVASMWGNSQMIHMHGEPQTKDGCVEVLEEFENVGPIQDMALVDLDRQGQCQLVTCSGVGQTGALSVLREGMGVESFGEVDIEGVRDMWSLTQKSNVQEHTFLILSLLETTRIFQIGDEGINEFSASNGLILDKRTLHCGQLSDDLIVQILEFEIRLLKSVDLSLVQSIPSTKKFTRVCSSPTQLFVSTGDGRLTYFELLNKQLIETKSIQLENDIACMDCSPLQMNTEISNTLAVGLWNEYTVKLIEVPSLKVLTTIPLKRSVLPRSVLLCVFEEDPNGAYLFVGMGDGKLQHFQLKPDFSVCEPRRISLGNQPIRLTTMNFQDRKHVMAFCDTPTLVSRVNSRLTYLNLSLRDVKVAVPWVMEDDPDAMALYAGNQLIIGEADEIKKLQIKKYPFDNFWPRRIGHLHTKEVSGYLVAGDVQHFSAQQHLFELQYFNQDLERKDVIKMPLGHVVETICPLHSTGTAQTPVFVVGSSPVVPSEIEPKQGFIELYTVNEKEALVKVSVTKTKGSPNAICSLLEKFIVAGVSSNVIVYQIMGDSQLKEVQKLSGNVQTVKIESRGNYVFTGDLMMSVSVFFYDQADQKLKEVARDMNQVWVTGTQIIDHNHFLSADTEGNLTVFEKSVSALSSANAKKLDIVGRYNLGLHMINALKKGSLAMKLQDDDDVEMADPNEKSKLAFKPECQSLGGTVSGAVVSLLTFNNEHFDFLQQLQNEISKLKPPIGELSWEDFRKSRLVDRREEASKFIDGDIIESFEELDAKEKDAIADKMQMKRETLETIVHDLSCLH